MNVDLKGKYAVRRERSDLLSISQRVPLAPLTGKTQTDFQEEAAASISQPKSAYKWLEPNADELKSTYNIELTPSNDLIEQGRLGHMNG
ncbi:hypothetical protein NliqN6_2937 [Naganishia liquefaciens]|uniref:Uncharacterized protein n=1 Tax=Naganishia liquefaciens TaxID=104408 RepID=A0A8H3TTT0_9TREE|nr:hypothetical protein NliqN6_2937 [Naganishia liquefaciens]